MQEEKTYLTPKEAAEILRVSESTLNRYLNDTENPLPSYKLSDKTIRIKKEELEKWMVTKFKEEKNE